MSEFDNEYTAGAYERNEAVEAFDDFEMSGEEMADVETAEEVFDTVEVPDDMEGVQAAVEAVEQVEAEAVDEQPEVIEEVAEEAVEQPEVIEEVAEEAVEEPEVVEEVAEEAVEQPAVIEDVAEAAVEQPEVVEEVAEAAVEQPEVIEEVAEEAVEEPEVVEEITEEAVEEPEVVEEVAEAAVEQPEVVEEITEEVDEQPEVVEEVAEEAVEQPEVIEEVAEETDEQPEVIEEIAEEAVEENEEIGVSEENEVEIDIMSTIIALENAAGDSNENQEAADAEESYAEVNTEQDEENENQEAAEEVSDDDYLDYDDTPRPKKIISGKAAVITMIVTGVVTIALIVGAVWMGITLKRDIGVTVASYSDRFNACSTKDFTLGELIGVELVSMSDESCTLSQNEINDLKAGKTVTKFNNLMNIKADTRLGKIVSMDITYDESLNEQKNPSVICMVLLGNALSGLFENIDSSDKAFITAYTALVEKCYPATEKGSDVYVYDADNGISVYVDYSAMSKTGAYSDVMIHIENKDPNYIDTNKLDFSWLPFDFSSKDAKSADETTSPSDN